MSTVPLGKISVSDAVTSSISADEISNALHRHASRDWGDLAADDVSANEAALQHGERLLSAYVSRRGVRFWVITDADRTASKVVLPLE
jgi:hypothetical protein